MSAKRTQRKPLNGIQNQPPAAEQQPTEQPHVADKKQPQNVAKSSSQLPLQPERKQPPDDRVDQPPAVQPPMSKSKSLSKLSDSSKYRQSNLSDKGQSKLPTKNKPWPSARLSQKWPQSRPPDGQKQPLKQPPDDQKRPPKQSPDLPPDPDPDPDKSATRGYTSYPQWGKATPSFNISTILLVNSSNEIMKC